MDNESTIFSLLSQFVRLKTFGSIFYTTLQGEPNLLIFWFVFKTLNFLLSYIVFLMSASLGLLGSSWWLFVYVNSIVPHFPLSADSFFYKLESFFRIFVVCYFSLMLLYNNWLPEMTPGQRNTLDSGKSK